MDCGSRKRQLTSGTLQVQCAESNRAIVVDGNLLTEEELKLIDLSIEVTHGLCNACLNSTYSQEMVASIRARMKATLS